MKNRSFFLAVALSLFFFLSIALLNNTWAAPARRGIATNEADNLCGGYWGGDEFVYYSLPDGWQAYYPELKEGSRSDEINTPGGTCIFENGMERSCCEQMGYTYTEDNVGINPTQIVLPTTFPPILGGSYDPVLIVVVACAACLCLVLAGTVAFLVYKKTKK